MRTHRALLGLAAILVVVWVGVTVAQPPPAPAPGAAQEEITKQVASAPCFPATYPGELRRIIGSVVTGVVFIAFFSGLFAYLILRQVYQQKVYLAAIERGVPVPLPAKRRADLRRAALVLIAVGLGFFIAVHVTLSFMPHPEHPEPLAASIWGIVPVLVGAALWTYQRLRAREEREAAGGAPQE